MAVIPLEYEHLMSFLWKLDVISPYEMGYRTVATIDQNGIAHPNGIEDADWFIVYPGISNGR